ncbi:MAG: CCA tRNA nucleotidyltransferase [bacterium]|nr:CCA tRNA nucleotidyltransferase [bacterium]
MLDHALKLLNKIESCGFKAYIVGGFVRNYLLGMESTDIDICTNAKPKDIRGIFQMNCLPNEEYGSVTVIIKNMRYEITTFRKEYSYVDHRKPQNFEFIDDLCEDLKRRDFLINTMCMDCHGNILDILGGKKDLESKIIHTVGNSYERFSEDAFRILRAVRFATILDFQLSDEIKMAIFQTKHLLKDISYERKREELDKIFTSGNVLHGVSLLLELGLDQELELFHLSEVKNYDDLIGVWAQLRVDEDTYRFTAHERELIEKIQIVLDQDNYDSFVLYHYGLYVNSVAAGIKNLDKKRVTFLYNALPIHSIRDIVINGKDVYEVLGRRPGGYIKAILKDIEEKILTQELDNTRDQLLDYVLKKYGNLC